MVLDAGYDIADGGFDEQCDRIRAHIRREIAKRLREVAKTDPVAFPCPGCGEDAEVSPSYFEKVRAGSVRLRCASSASGRSR